MDDKIDAIIKEVGRPYNMFWEDGNYEGCFYPIYKVYSYLPTYPLPSMDKHKENYVYGIRQILKYFKEVDSPTKGDMLACEFRGELHVALMLNEREFIHVFKEHKLQINKLRFFDKYDLKFFRAVI